MVVFGSGEKYPVFRLTTPIGIRVLGFYSRSDPPVFPMLSQGCLALADSRSSQLLSRNVIFNDLTSDVRNQVRSSSSSMSITAFSRVKR